MFGHWSMKDRVIKAGGIKALTAPNRQSGSFVAREF
jgi:hypothetical protein